MNKFSWYDAASIEEAQKEVNATVSQTIQPDSPENAAVFKASGIDLLDLMKEGLSGPAKVVGIRNIPGLDEISFDPEKGLRVGAMVTLSQISGDDRIKANYLALHQAASRAATPQIRNMATLGGNLAQRTHCWYFRSKELVCFRKGSSTCFAHVGENENHAIMSYGYCVSIHSSSLATALMAFDSIVEIKDKDGKIRLVPIKNFFVLPTVDRTRENILEPGELMTAVILPAPKRNTVSYYIKMGSRKSQDWPMAEVAVVAELSGNVCKSVNVALGAAAPVPLISKLANDSITGKTITEATAAEAGRAAMQIALPLSENGYKIPVFQTIIKRALLAVV
ncbi:MAG: molybdopterin-binding protein [Chlorobi bacterium]|nr:molybdopterin-binding protein [Chlorobiota bacterium]